jgi:hypothetical protein
LRITPKTGAFLEGLMGFSNRAEFAIYLNIQGKIEEIYRNAMPIKIHK